MRGNRHPCERSWRHDPKAGRSRKVSGRRLGRTAPKGLVPSAGRAARAKAPAVSDVVEVGASNLAWSPAADMRERLARHLPARWREALRAGARAAAREPALGRGAAHLEDGAPSEALGRPRPCRPCPGC